MGLSVIWIEFPFERPLANSGKEVPGEVPTSRDLCLPQWDVGVVSGLPVPLV